MPVLSYLKLLRVSQVLDLNLKRCSQKSMPPFMRQIKNFRWQIAVIVWIAIFGTANYARGEKDLSPCDRRPHFIDPPWVSTQYYCAEQVIVDDSGGELGFTSLVASPDGSLYATRPLQGEVLRLTDLDGDGLPETPEVIAEGLSYPNGLAWFDGSLYITGGANIYRLRDGELTILVNDLPSGAGFWTGGIAVGDNQRMYVATGATCDSCTQNEATRGAILSFSLDGLDQQVEVTGLRRPNDLTLLRGELWTIDSAPDYVAANSYFDEINRVVSQANFGWPHCIGMNKKSDVLEQNYDCQATAAPSITLASHSNPNGIVGYEGTAFPNLKNSLLVTLGGSYNQAELIGYTLVSIKFDDSGNALEPHVILPEIPHDGPQWAGINLQKIHYQASGFWPHRPYDVTISREGWIYVSVGGGRIWALRPR
ncbi:MAG: PQQ-dependent sugar dehydrogenase [Anaerolineae bacterium]